MRTRSTYANIALVLAITSLVGFLPDWVLPATQFIWLIDYSVDLNHRGVAFMLREAEISKPLHDTSRME
jgi:hypothetical protein